MGWFFNRGGKGGVKRYLVFGLIMPFVLRFVRKHFILSIIVAAAAVMVLRDSGRRAYVMEKAGVLVDAARERLAGWLLDGLEKRDAGQDAAPEDGRSRPESESFFGAAPRSGGGAAMESRSLALTAAQNDAFLMFPTVLASESR